jgi:tetratricopeptide (TPR) repeat protein
VKKQQVIVASTGLLLLLGLYFFGNTVSSKNVAPAPTAEKPAADNPIDIKDILQASESKLDPSRLSYVNRLKNSVVRGDVKGQQLKAYHQLSSFWRDSVQNAFLPAAYYLAESAKLENSEKSLTFAAQLFLNNLRGQHPALKIWMANQAKELFEKALALNSQNDSSKIGLGGAYIFGSSAANPQEIMQGIQQILEVARRDSTNMYAQFMLGLGGIESGQLDKAIERLTTVVSHQPENVEAIIILAETCEQKGRKAEAVKWFEAGKKLIGNPEMVKEIDQRIKALQQ